MSLSSIWTLIKCIPELFSLIQILEKAAKEAETERKVKADVQTIKNAFANKDPSQLNALFNSK